MLRHRRVFLQKPIDVGHRLHSPPMTVVFHPLGPVDPGYGRRLSIGFTFLVFLETIRFAMCNNFGGYFLPSNLKRDRQRVSVLCLLFYSFTVSAFLAGFTSETGSLGEIFVTGMLLGLLVYWVVYTMMVYTNPCWRRSVILGDLFVGMIVWGITMLAQTSV